MRNEPVYYSFLKASEGGIGQDYAVYLAKQAGAKKVVRATSMYVGHTAIAVTATKRVHKRIERRLFGR